MLVGLGYAAGGEPCSATSRRWRRSSTAYVRAVGTARGAPADFCGPMAKQQRMYVATLTAVACAAAAALGAGRRLALRIAADSALAVIALGTSRTALRRLVRLARRCMNDASRARGCGATSTPSTIRSRCG